MNIKCLAKRIKLLVAITSLIWLNLPLLGNAQLIDWDEAGNGSTFLENGDVDEGAAGGGVGTHTGVDNDIFDISDNISVDIAWTEIGTLLGSTTYGDDFVTWQDPADLTGPTPNGPFGGITSEGFIVIGWDNDFDTPTDGVDLTFTFSEALFGLEFSLLDVDEAEALSPDPNNPWDDVVAVRANGSVFLAAKPAFYTLKPCVTVSNETFPSGVGNAFEGISADSNDADIDTAPLCALPAGVPGSNVLATSDGANVDFAINRESPTIAPLPVTTLRVGYRPGDDERFPFAPTSPYNPSGQRIGISNIAFPLISGHVYRDADGNGTQNGTEIDLAGIDIFLCATPNPTAPCDPTDVAYLRTVTTDSNGDWVANTTSGSVQSALDVTDLPVDLDTTPTEGTVNTTSTATAGSNTFVENDGFKPLTPPQDISGTVREDTTGNGAGDTAVAGATIILYSDPNGDGDPADGVVVATTVTDASGDYSFVGVNTGDYVLVKIDPAGYSALSDGDSSADAGGDQANISTTDSLIPVSVAASESDADNNFVINRPGLISGTVWLDEDRDGIHDIEEVGLTRVQLELQNGVCIPSSDCPVVLTDQYGNYEFAGLVAGTYTIELIDASLPTGVTITAGQFGFDPRVVVLAAGGEEINQDFGYIALTGTGIIGDRVWSDADADGIQDAGEAGLAGVTLELRTPGPDGIYGNGDDIAIGSPVTTDADGDYLFTNVPFGDYAVVITDTGTVLTGYSATFGPQSQGGLVSKPVTLNAQLNTITDLDFGFDSTATLTITDRIWYDADADATQDIGEPGIPGVTVDLLDAGGNVVASTTTDSNGDFSFAGVPEGLNYTIRISDNADQLDGMVETTATGGSQLISGSLATAAATAGPVDTLNTVGDDGTPTFGFNNPGSIAGVLWSDADTSQAQNNGEPGISGITVTLTPPLTTDLGAGLGVAITTTTAADGSYLFDGLPPGDYVIEVLSPPAGVHTEDPDSDDDNHAVVTLGIGQGLIGQDFGYFNGALADISGTVFNDPDKDGVREVDGNDGIAGNADDEAGIALISLSLIDCGAGTCSDGDEVVIATTVTADGTTDANGDLVVDKLDLGFYEFTGLPAGNYQVAVTDTAALLAGYDITSGLDQLPVTLLATDITDVDFGYINAEVTGSLRGEVFIDEAIANNIPDDSETNLSGVKIYLCSAPLASPTCDPADPEYLAQTVTDANGEYGFAGLPAGVYIVDSDATTVPTGLSLSLDPTPVALSEGENVRDVNIAYVAAPLSGVLSGVVWVDADSNGRREAGEAPIGGVDIFVFSLLGGPIPIATGTTAADGSWIVTGLTGPTLLDGLLIKYNILDIPLYLVSTQPTNLPLGALNYIGVNLLSDPDRNISNLDFGFPPTVLADLGSIAGTIYSDADQNNSYLSSVDGELAGVTVNLYDSGGNLIASTTTDATGDYSFVGLPDDGYTVLISDLGNVLQDLNPLETISNPITILLGADITDQNAGFASNTAYGSIGNKFFFDADDDGVFDDGEPGIAGITIQVWQDNSMATSPNMPLLAQSAPIPGVDNLVRTIKTDADGEYYATDLPPGQYIVLVADALSFTELSDGATITGGTADNAAKPWLYTMTTGALSLAADFGITGTNSLSGKLFIEDESLVEPVLMDGNDTVLAGVELDGTTTPTGGAEPLDVSSDVPAEGVKVVLLLETSPGVFVEILSTTTDVNGDYSFTGLPDGNYKVEVRSSGTAIDGFGQTGDPDLMFNALGNGSEDLVCDSPTAALCDDATTVALSGGTAVTDVNFGYQKNFVTTPVTINMFSAIRSSGGVDFSWETSNEVGHMGYQIYARMGDDWLLLNDVLITQSDGEDALHTRNYQFSAYNLDAQWFALIDVSMAEELTAHGPYQLGQSYGELIDKAKIFDWGKVPQTSPSKIDVQNSVQQRLRLIPAEPRGAARQNDVNSVDQAGSYAAPGER